MLKYFMGKPKTEHLTQIIKSWGLSHDLSFIRKVENWIYQDVQTTHFVRMTEPDHRSLSQLGSELDWMFYLQGKGINFAHPIKSKDGQLVEEVSDGDERFFVSVFKCAPGFAIKEVAEFTDSILMNWGRLLGQLHLATADYTPLDSIAPRPAWNEERNYHIIKEGCLLGDPLFESYQKLDAFLNGREINRHNYGLIHADIHHGNFFVQDDQLTLFDFDDCHYHWFMYDVAVPIFSWEIALRDKLSPDKALHFKETFLKGYDQVKPLGNDDLKAINDFYDYRCLLLHYWAKKNLNDPHLNSGAGDWMTMAIQFTYDQLIN
jgi:Ser/Thr protein kinase RdoA (MazF antagonist)